MTISNIEETNTPRASAGLAPYQISAPHDGQCACFLARKSPGHGPGLFDPPLESEDQVLTG
jgi:hypothetical protein